MKKLPIFVLVQLLVFNFIHAQSFFEPREILTDNSILTAPIDIQYPSLIAAIDLENDQDYDAVVCSSVDPLVYFFKYSNANGYSYSGSIDFLGADLGYMDIEVGDFDNDGFSDLLLATRRNFLTIAYNNGNGGFDDIQLISTDAAPGLVGSNDIDGDGNLDIFSDYGNSLYWKRNLGNGNFSPFQLVASPILRGIKVSFLDFDDDDDMDIILQYSSSSFISNTRFKVIEYEDGNFSETDDLLLNYFIGDHVVQDVDGDGIQEVVTVNGSTSDSMVTIYDVSAIGLFTNPIRLIDTIPNSSKISAGDIDADGDVDFLLAMRKGSASSKYPDIGWIENLGNSNYSEIQSISTNANITANCVLQDVNNDGDLDILGISTNNKETSFYENILGEITKVSGRIYWDKNNNNNFDSGDQPILTSLEISGKDYQYTSNLDGYYNFYTRLPEGNYDLLVEAPKIYECDNSGIIDLNFVDPSDGRFNFDLIPEVPVSNDFILAGTERFCTTLSGSVYEDLNGNGIRENNEKGVRGVKVFALATRQSTYTDFNGDYELSFTEDRTEKIGISVEDVSFSCGGYYEATIPGKGVLYTIGTTTERDDLDFGLSKQAGFESGLISLAVYGGNRAGQSFYSWMDFKSCGSNSETCTLRVEHDTLVSLVQASLTPHEFGEGYIEWHFQPGTMPQGYCMQMDWFVSRQAQLNANLHWEASLECPPLEDPTPDNNLLIRDIVVISSNARRAQESCKLYSVGSAGELPEVLPIDFQELSFVATFQNTLQDTVFELTIIDTLPEELRGETVTSPFSSHPHTFSVRDSSILIWKFTDIIIPSKEVDELNSNGFVQFNVNLKKDLPGGTELKNEMHIRLNNGFAETTNEVLHRLDIASVKESILLEESIFTLYPNPSNDKVFLELNKTTLSSRLIRVTNVTGSVIYQNELTSNSATILTKYWTEGVYFVVILDQNGNRLGVKKLVKI